MRKIALILFILTSILIFSVPSPAEDTFTVAIPMVEGLEETTLIKHLENLSLIMGKKLDTTVVSRQLVYSYGDNLLDRVITDFKEKKSDVSYVYGIDYAQYLSEGKRDLIPLFTLTMDKSSLMKECLFIRKGEFTDVEELRGKKWAASHLYPTRYLLYKNGIDEPLDHFFSTIDYMSDAPLYKLVERLTSGDVDAISTYAIIMRLSGELTKKDSTIEPLYCDVYDHTWIFVARKDMDPAFLTKFRKIMLNSNKDKDFDSFKFAFQVIDGKFAPISQDDLKKIIDIAKLIKEKGWIKEQLEFYKKYHK